jgi:hypothetical protein
LNPLPSAHSIRGASEAMLGLEVYPEKRSEAPPAASIARNLIARNRVARETGTIDWAAGSRSESKPPTTRADIFSDSVPAPQSGSVEGIAFRRHPRVSSSPYTGNLIDAIHRPSAEEVLGGAHGHRRARRAHSQW